MELPLEQQLRALGEALALGLALGLGYDLLRPLRQGRQLFRSWLPDGLFALLCFLTAFFFGLHSREGRLGLWELASLLLGFRLYLGLLSSVFMAVYGPFLSFLADILASCKKLVKKSSDLLKFFFSKKQE